MARPLRIDYPNAWHHVMNRARLGYDLYIARDDYQYFIDLLIESAALFNVRVAAYCLMANHYHLLVQTPDANLSRFMRHINGVYTQRYNGRHHLDGTLFRGRYKSVLVDAESYLLQLVRYIHNNPVKAGLVVRADLYAWSSHKGYLSKAPKWCWLSKDFVLAMISAQPGARVKTYRQFMAEEEDERLLDLFNLVNLAKLPSMLGDQAFTAWVKNQFAKEKMDKQIPASKCLTPEVDDVVAQVCRYYGIGADELRRVRRGKVNEPRDVAIYLIRNLRAEPLSRIGPLFDMQNYSSVSSAVMRIKERLNRDSAFQRRLRQIQISVQKCQTEPAREGQTKI